MADSVVNFDASSWVDGLGRVHGGNKIIRRVEK